MREFMTEAQAAEFLGMPEKVLATFRRAKNGPAHSKLGQTVLYALPDIRNWVLSNRQTCQFAPVEIEIDRTLKFHPKPDAIDGADWYDSMKRLGEAA